MDLGGKTFERPVTYPGGKDRQASGDVRLNH